MKKILYVLIGLLCFSCTKADKKKQEPLPEKAQAETAKFELLDKASYDISKLNHEGKIVHQKNWKDTNGENVVLFTQKEEELFCYHYAIQADSVKLLRRVYDFEKDCEFDLMLNFLEESIRVTDLDKNQLGEISFAYKKGCVSDVSPVTLKLLILENGEKYILRGYTLIEMGEESYGGDYKVDPSFEKAPASFLVHAKKVWDEVKKENFSGS